MSDNLASGQDNLYRGYEVVIGLEVHTHLRTQSKLFSPAPVRYGDDPNVNTHPIDLALPGVLPVLNRSVIELAMAVETFERAGSDGTGSRQIGLRGEEFRLLATRWLSTESAQRTRWKAARQQRGTIVTVTDVRDDDYENVLIVNVHVTRQVVSSPQGDFQVTATYTCQQVAE